MTKKCTTNVTHSNVKVEENRRKAVFKNPQQKNYTVSKIDDCLITQGLRCDYLISETDDASVLIELKGTDVDHACEQLLASVIHQNVTSLLKPRIGFLVICSRYPRVDTFVLKAKQKCAREFKAGFHVVCNQGEFEIDKVVQINGRL